MQNKNISTLTGSVILVIIAITAGTFVWTYEKGQSDDVYQGQVTNNPIVRTPINNQQEQSLSTSPQSTTPFDQKTTPAKVVTQPKMPTIADEAGKSPEQLVKDFYEWYIGNTDYNYSLVYPSDKEKVVDIKKLIKNSPFISSTYEKNMNKSSDGADPILCNQDNEHNVFKNTEELTISGNTAKTFAVIELVSDPKLDIKIQVMLKNESKQWKIDEINCHQFRF